MEYVFDNLISHKTGKKLSVEVTDEQHDNLMKLSKRNKKHFKKIAKSMHDAFVKD